LTDYIRIICFYKSGKQTLSRETATEVSLSEERHVAKDRFIPTNESGALHISNVMLNYTHGLLRDAPLAGDTQL
ncbi:MAG: hypothetical protein LBU34_16600, partial [Planctomycetaceae bacterium]|nr:hypothetical protein [Planctomycetaceae bacterium]